MRLEGFCNSARLGTRSEKQSSVCLEFSGRPAAVRNDRGVKHDPIFDLNGARLTGVRNLRTLFDRRCEQGYSFGVGKSGNRLNASFCEALRGHLWLPRSGAMPTDDFKRSCQEVTI